MNEQKQAPGRKIDLDTSVYNPWTKHIISLGDTNCDHDFDPKPTVDDDNYAVWNCTRCDCIVEFEVYD